MNLKEMLEAAKSRIAQADSVEELKAAQEEYDKISEQIKLAEQKGAILDGLKPAEETQVEKKETPASLGAFAVKELDTRSLKSARGAVGTGFGFKANTDLHTTPTINVTDTKVVDVQPRPLYVRDLFGSEAISGNSLTYFVLQPTEGKPAKTAEGAKKPQIHVGYDSKTVALEKIASFFKESDELLEDAAFMESAINNRGIYEHNLAVENELVSTLLGTSGIQTVAFKDNAQDTLYTAMTNIQTATGYTADAIVINPADYQTLRLAKDTNDQYMGGGFFYGEYGNGSLVQQPGIWGLPTVVTTAVEKGTAIVGAFKIAGSVVTKAGSGLRVEVSNANEDDFITNRVTVRVEERLLLATRVPAAFAKVTLAGAAA